MYQPYVLRGFRRKMHYIQNFIQTFQLCFVEHAIAIDVARSGYRRGVRPTRRGMATDAACDRYRHGVQWLPTHFSFVGTNTACNGYRHSVQCLSTRHTMAIDMACNGSHCSVEWPLTRHETASTFYGHRRDMR